MITSLTNEKIKRIVKLNKDNSKEDDEYVVEGKHLVFEAIKANVVSEIYTTSLDLIDGILVSNEVMKKISTTSSNIEVCAVCKKRNYDFSNITDKILVLDDVQDPGNVGAILRNALAFGYKTVFLSNHSASIYNSKTLRSSQGAIFKLNFFFGETLDFISQIPKEYKIYGTSLKNATNLASIKKQEKLCLILGNEGNGISKDVLNCVDESIFIEIEDMESLNVSVAAGIIMYYLK